MFGSVQSPDRRGTAASPVQSPGRRGMAAQPAAPAAGASPVSPTRTAGANPPRLDPGRVDLGPGPAYFFFSF